MRLNVGEIVKIVVLLSLLFPFCLLFGYSGYWFLFGDPSAHYYPDYYTRVKHHRDMVIRSVAVGSALGLGAGGIIGFRMGMEEGYRIAREQL